MVGNTYTIYLSGKGKYIGFDKPNQWGRYSVVLYPNAESLEKIRDLQAQGLKNVLKKDEDGYYLSIHRDHQKDMGGKIVFLGPPLLLEADGKSLLQGIRIGHGSDITCKVQIRSYVTDRGSGAKGVAARLESVRVDNLIPYAPAEHGDDQVRYQVKNFDTQEPQLF